MRSLSGGSRNEKGLLARFQDRDPAQRLGSVFSHSEGLEKGSSDTCLTAFPRSDLQALCSQNHPLLLQRGHRARRERMAWLYLWPLQAESGLGTPGNSHSLHMEQYLDLDRRGSGGRWAAVLKGHCANPKAGGRSHSLMPWAGFEFINKSKIQAALI